MPYKNKEDQIKWREAHLQETKEYNAKNRRKYKDRVNQYQRNYIKNNPWMRAYYNALWRTLWKDGPYYKKGIKFDMTVDDFKELWFRDKAWLLKQPSIDRIKSHLHYTKDNCQYIELRENQGKRG